MGVPNTKTTQTPDPKSLESFLHALARIETTAVVRDSEQSVAMV